MLELGFDARGVAIADNWQVDVGTLRGWLRKLRGICTHPQVGQLQNQADKLHKPGVLKTIGEVLEVSDPHLYIRSCALSQTSRAEYERPELAQSYGR